MAFGSLLHPRLHLASRMPLVAALTPTTIGQIMIQINVGAKRIGAWQPYLFGCWKAIMGSISKQYNYRVSHLLIITHWYHVCGA